MAALIRALDWSQTPLGAIGTWPQNLRTIVDLVLASCSPMIVLWGKDLIQIYNDGYAKLAAGKHPKAMGQPTFECWPEAKHITSSIRERVWNGESIMLEDCQFPLLRSGSAENSSWTVCYSPLRDEVDVVQGLFVMMLETTEHDYAEHALRESEERFRQFAENSTSVLWIADIETQKVEYVSPAFENVWGQPPGPMPHDLSRWAETVHPEDRGDAINALERVSGRGDVVVLEYRIVRPDGTVRWIRDTSFPIRSTDGAVRRIAGIAQDMTKHNGSLAYLIMADDAARSSVSLLLRSSGYEVQEFSSAKAFLAIAPALMAGCVLLDIQAPEAGGLSVPKELKSRRINLPVIITSARGDVALAVDAMKAGAVDFIEAPYEQEKLLGAIASALAKIGDLERHTQAAVLATTHIADMSSREREVLDRIVSGGSNKTIGKDLGISPRTVEVYRKRVMEKLGAQSLPEAVRMAFEAGVKPGP